MKFDVESTEFLSLMRPDASFPPHHFAMLADEARCQVGSWRQAAAAATAEGRGLH